MSTKRILSILISLIILSCFFSCDKPQPEEKAGAFEASVAILCEKTDVTKDEAVAILEVLSSLGLDEQIEEIYPATDGEGKDYYKIWFGLNLLSVYLDNNVVSTVYKHGKAIYPDIPEPDVNIDSEANKDDEENDEVPTITELNATLVSLTSPVEAGKSATIEIIAEPNTKYSITVKYSSGPSTAKGLEPKTSDESGLVSWTWRVGANVKPGEYIIEIKSGNAVYKTTLTVEASVDE